MFLIFDIGGTRMRLAISSEGKNISKKEIVDTPKNFEEGMTKFKEVLAKLTGGESIEKSVGGIRRLNPTKDKLLKDFRLPDWSDKPLKQQLSEITKSTVFLENDTALAGLGEATFGAGKDFNIVTYLTISTGVGGARIVNKKIDENKFGFEPGHQIVDFDWSAKPELKKLNEIEGFGQLEAYISGASFEKIYNKKPKEVLDEEVWDESARILAYGLVNVIVHWSPEVVILGGGMMGNPGISIDKVKMYLKDTLKIFPDLPEIKKAELEDAGGLYGALVLLKENRTLKD